MSNNLRNPLDYRRHSGVATLRDLPIEDADTIYDASGSQVTIASFMVRKPGLYAVCVSGNATCAYAVRDSFVSWNTPDDPIAPRPLPEIEEAVVEYLSCFDPDIVAYRRLHGSKINRTFPDAKALLSVVRRVSPVPCVSVDTVKAGVMANEFSITSTDRPADISKKLMQAAIMAIRTRSKKPQPRLHAEKKQRS